MKCGVLNVISKFLLTVTLIGWSLVMLSQDSRFLFHEQRDFVACRFLAFLYAQS